MTILVNIGPSIRLMPDGTKLLLGSSLNQDQYIMCYAPEGNVIKGAHQRFRYTSSFL